MGISWIQSAVRVLQNVQDSLAAASIKYTTRAGQEQIVPARLDVSSGQSVSLDGLTTFYTERVFKVSKKYLPATPERGDSIILFTYDENGRPGTPEHYKVMSEMGLDVTVPQGNFEDSYRIYAKRVNHGS